MYSGTTNIYDRKTAGQEFTKPVHMEGTTENSFSPESCFSL
jgi:hypothetical protein